MINRETTVQPRFLEPGDCSLALTFQIRGRCTVIEAGLKHEWHERIRNARNPFASFVSFREFRDSQLLPKRPVQQRLEQMLRLALGFILPGESPRTQRTRTLIFG